MYGSYRPFPQSHRVDLWQSMLERTYASVAAFCVCVWIKTMYNTHLINAATLRADAPSKSELTRVSQCVRGCVAVAEKWIFSDK